MQRKDALIVVDVQNDFCPGGALAVAEGDRTIPVLNRHIERFRRAGMPVFATRDWHPEDTSHFKTHGGPWPPHCIRGTRGAEFHTGLALGADTVILSKGMSAEDDGYSGFQATDETGVGLAERLRRCGVERVFIGGLATDYCVKSTVLDALREGFRVVLIEDAIRGVDLRPGDAARAVAEMVRAGAECGGDF